MSRLSGVRLYILSALLFVAFDVFYRDFVAGFHPNRNKLSFVLQAKPVSALVGVVTGSARVFMRVYLRAFPNVFTA